MTASIAAAAVAVVTATAAAAVVTTVDGTATAAEGGAAATVVGYTMAALDSTAFYDGLAAGWLGPVAAKYPRPDACGRQVWSAEQTLVEELYAPTFQLTGLLATQYPAHL